MAENKKSFILYADIIHTVRKLTDDKAGLLFKTILSFVNDELGSNPDVNDPFVDLVFEPIKHQLKRDLKRYEQYIDKQRVNGAKGGRPLKSPKTQAFKQKPKKADNDNVNDNVTVNDTDINISLAQHEKYFFEDFEIQRMAMQENRFSPSELQTAKTEFWNSKKIDPEIKVKSYSDTKRHFLNWCRQNKKRIKDGIKETTNHGRISEDTIKEFLNRRNGENGKPEDNGTQEYTEVGIDS